MWSSCKLGLGQSCAALGQAIANHDFAKARSCSDEERMERDKLRLLYQKYGLSGWMFE